jgi:glycosyltransferase involved in cell wall biosynthesis
MISKALLVGAYQRKLEEIAAYDDICLTVIVPHSWQGLPLERAFTEGYDLREWPLHFNGKFHLHYYPGIRRVFDETRPQIVHIDEEPYNLATYLLLREAKRVGAKALFFTWQNLPQRYPPPFSWMEGAVLRGADYGIAGNREAVEVWRGKGFKGPLKVIPQFGVDPALFSPHEGLRPDRPFTIGYAGRLVPEKGLDLIIKAALGINLPWQIRFAGDGPYRDALVTLAGILNAGGQVKFEGSISSTAMPAFYREVDVIVLPSLTRQNWKEQFGRVLIEAMASGVPVIGSDSGAIPEVIGDAGLIIPEGDVEGLRGALRSLMSDPALYEGLAAAGRERVLRHYTQAQVAAETVEIYREML